MNWEPVIGLEVHAQLLTTSKLFCACSTRFGAEPNTQTCAVCLGMPGALPVLNGAAVRLAVRAGLALGCDVQQRSEWARKNYFYPDLPKGYQISQFTSPFALGGHVDLGNGQRVGLIRIHMEEDAGKNIHDDALAGRRSLVDFNRGGTPLIEIVSKPELYSSDDAATYLRRLRRLLRHLHVCDGNMQEGSLRCDANVSLRPAGSTGLGTRAELKNINSFRFLKQALDYEIERQRLVLETGGRLVQETRLWDDRAQQTRSMRSKEEAHDYRYFPDPDLPALVIGDALVDGERRALPELPAVRVQRYLAAGLSLDDADVLVEEPEVAAFFDAAIARHNNAKVCANWVVNEVSRELKDRRIDALPFTGEAIGELVALIDSGAISGKIAKDVFAEMLISGGAPNAIVAAKGWKQVSDTASLEPIIDAVIAGNPESVASYRAGKQNVIGFFVGQVMQKTGGQANPKTVQALLRARLDG